MIEISKLFYLFYIKNKETIWLTQVQIEGAREVTRKILYNNLDMIISIGYRVNSKRGIEFRKWAYSILKQYMFKGFDFINQTFFIS